MWLVVWGRILSLALVTCVVMKKMGSGNSAMVKGVLEWRVVKRRVDLEKHSSTPSNQLAPKHRLLFNTHLSNTILNQQLFLL